MKKAWGEGKSRNDSLLQDSLKLSFFSICFSKNASFFLKRDTNATPGTLACARLFLTKALFCLKNQIDKIRFVNEKILDSIQFLLAFLSNNGNKKDPPQHAYKRMRFTIKE